MTTNNNYPYGFEFRHDPEFHEWLREVSTGYQYTYDVEHDCVTNMRFNAEKFIKLYDDCRLPMDLADDLDVSFQMR